MRITNYIYIYIFLFILACSKNKNKDNSENLSSDSLFIYTNNAKNDKLPIDKRIISNLKSFRILKSQKNSLSNREKMYDVSKTFYILKNEKEFKKAINQTLNISIEEKDTLHIAKCLNLIANQHINLSQNDSAFYYLLKSERLFSKIKDSLDLGKNYIDKAFVQLYESDYSGCELSCIQGLSYLKNFNLSQNLYDAYNLVGISSNELKDYENALVYHTKALNIAKEKRLNPLFHYEENSKNNIGIVYQYQNKHKEAIVNFKSALKGSDLLIDSPLTYAMITDNLAYSKFKLKDFDGLPSLFYTSLKIREQNGFSSGIITNKIHLSEFYAEKKDTIHSQQFAKEALELAKTTKISADILASLKQISLVDTKNSSQYSKEYIKITDSLQLEERKAKDKFARIAFETDEIIQEKDKLAEQNRSLLYFFVGTLFVGLLLFVIRTQRAKNRELMLKQQQQKANEEIYSLMISQQATIEENRVREKKRIAQELHDGVLGRLFGARLNLDSLNRSTDEESINSRFNYLNELKNIEQDIREISHDLNREKHALINNFVAIVQNLLEEQSSSFEPELTSSIDEKIQWDTLGNNTKINLYRILQESLQNINKYAQAKHIHVEFKTDGDNITLRVIDDGVGFEVDTKKRGIGLQNMLSRTSESEGTFEVQSQKGKGTTITVSVPLVKTQVEA